AETFYTEIGVIEDARAVRGYATAMHDPTEGGLVDGLLELASASGVGIDVEESAIPIRPETRRICGAIGVDPLRIFGSGALVATVPEAQLDAALSALKGVGIEAAEIGVVKEAETPAVTIGESTHAEPVRDDLYALWEEGP
ncbi:MAG: AIR synthase-related protein, partial [Halodesulfurarchaeum sp.]